MSKVIPEFQNGFKKNFFTLYKKIILYIRSNELKYLAAALKIGPLDGMHMTALSKFMPKSYLL